MKYLTLFLLLLSKLSFAATPGHQQGDLILILLVIATVLLGIIYVPRFFKMLFVKVKNTLIRLRHLDIR